MNHNCQSLKFLLNIFVISNVLQCMFPTDLEVVKLIYSVKTKVDFCPPARAEPLAQQNTGPLAGAGPLVSRYRRPNLW